MLLIILFIIVGIIYFIYMSGSEKEYQRQLKNEPIKKEILEDLHKKEVMDEINNKT